ncbi:MAG: hypothetical protein ACI9TH_000218 [Kiritimatiellia bacterium]|jgi:hypothetical protein
MSNEANLAPWDEDELASVLDQGSDAEGELLHVLNTLRSDPDETPSEDLTRRIILVCEPARRRVNPFLALAATFLLLACSLLILERGPKERQLAVNDGIEWLVAQQESDGHWDPSKTGGHPVFTRGVTALALMALMDSGREKRYASVITAAGAYLMQRPPEREGQAFSYNECLATLALMEMHKRQPTPPLKDHLDRALSSLVQRQNHFGGWGYETHRNFSYQKGAPANSSVTVWPLLALEQAVAQGWAAYEAPLRRARNWMALQVDDTGYLGYRRPGDHPNGTQTLLAIGLLGLPDLPEGTRDRIRDNLIKETSEKSDTYQTYFAARALQQDKKPLSRLQRQLMDRQGADGSWSSSQDWDGTGGRLVATALAALSLSIDTP